MATPAPNIFDTLAQQDTQRMQHDQTAAAQPNIFDQIAANGGKAPETTAPTASMGARVPTAAQANPETATDPFQRAGRQMTGGFARLLMDATDKLREIENFTEEGKAEHPVQAFMGHIANKLEGLTFGNEQHPEEAIGSGKYGLLNNPVTAALIPGAEGEPALAGAVRGGANLVKAGVSALRGGGEEAPGLIKQVLKGKEVAQQPARKALEAGAKASAADAGVEGGEAAGKGVRTLLDEPIHAAHKVERATYDAINKAAGTDLKSLYDYRNDLQEALEDPTNIGQKANLQKELATTEESISKGEAQATKGGISPEAVKEAEGKTQQRYAMENLKQRLFNNESVVKGNVEHGAEESINVDAAIREVEKLDKPSKFAREGTPSRLKQALGQEGAAKLKQALYDAQKAGEKALARQKLAKLIGKGAGIGLAGTGLGGAIIHHALGGQE